MKIAIVGAGSLGCVFGSLLHKAGEDVWLIHHTKSHVQTINERGVILSIGGKEDVVRLKATTNPAEVGTAEVILFLIKSYDTAIAAGEAVPMVGPDTYAMTLQNGIGNVETIAEILEMDRIIYGTTIVGAFLKAPGHVIVDVPLGVEVDAYIGDWSKKKSQPLLNICQAFNNAGIHTELPDYLDKLVWRKLAMASATGMTSALTALKLGDLREQDEGAALLSLIVKEVVAVANKKGIEMDAEEIIKFVLATAAEHREHKSSMLMSILNKKKTEIGSLNEAVAREAGKLGLSAPTNKAVALLVRIIEKTYEQRVKV